MSTDPDDERSREELRAELIKEASQRLEGQSVDEFSTTKVAEACNTSRMMIYTLFGGKPGLLKAVYDSKAEELGERFAAIEAEDPIDRFYELGHVYRDFMLEHAALFDTVFSLEAVQNFEGNQQLIERVEEFEYFEEILDDMVEAGILPEDTDVSTLTDIFWGSVNGLIRLKILGFYPNEETAREHYDRMAFTLLAGEAGEDVGPV